MHSEVFIFNNFLIIICKNFIYDVKRYEPIPSVLTMTELYNN